MSTSTNLEEAKVVVAEEEKVWRNSSESPLREMSKTATEMPAADGGSAGKEPIKKS